MSKVKVEAITVEEAILRVREVYAGNGAQFKTDLNNAVKAAQERAQIQQVGTNDTKKLKM